MLSKSLIQDFKVGIVLARDRLLNQRVTNATYFDAIWNMRDHEQDRRQEKRDQRQYALRPILTLTERDRERNTTARGIFFKTRPGCPWQEKWL